MSASGNSTVNPLLNRAVTMDSAMLMNILIELINSKPLSCINLPDFRIEQLIKIATKRIGPVTEKKTLEPLCAIYCICMYYGMCTAYKTSLIFKVLALLQSLQSEALIVTTNLCGKKIYTPDLCHTLCKDGDIDINYKLETFTEALNVARLTCRELYSLMKVVFRIGKRGGQIMSYTVEEKKKQARYSECIQPYGVYFMCGFAYAHIATILHSKLSLNIYPGAVETLVVMILTTCTPPTSRIHSNSSDTTTTDGNNIFARKGGGGVTAEEILLELQREEERKLAEEVSEIPKVVAVSIKLSYETFMNMARKLAIFVAHIVCDDRSLQEVRITQSHLSRNFQHPDIVFTQFRVSGVKNMMYQDQLPSTKASHTHASGTGTVAGRTSTPGKKSVIEDRPITSTADTCRDTAAAAAAAGGGRLDRYGVHGRSKKNTNKGIIDITETGYHFLNRTCKPLPWHLKDPAEADFEFDGNPGNVHGNGKGFALTADRLKDRGQKQDFLPALSLNKHGVGIGGGGVTGRSKLNTPGRNTTRTGREGGGGGGGSIETVSELPLPSGRITGREGFRQPSARRPKSSRSSASSDGAASDSDVLSSAEDATTQLPSTSAGLYKSPSAGSHTSLFSANPFGNASHQYKYGAKKAKPVSEDNSFISADQKISGYWSMGKQFRPVFVLLDTLQDMREYHSYFTENYAIEPFLIDPESDILSLPSPLSSKPVYEACKVMEAQYYHLGASLVLPRILDPTQEVYWICHYVIEHLAKKTTQGFGFHPSAASELAVLKKQFKNFKTKDKAADAMVVQLSPQRSTLSRADGISGSGDYSNNSNKGKSVLLPPLHQLPASTMKSTDKKKSRYLNIKDRLAAAAAEANMEYKVLDMQRQIWKEEAAAFERADLEDPDKTSPSRSRLLSGFSEELNHTETTHQQQQLDEGVAGSGSKGPVPSLVWSCPPHKDKPQVATFIGQEDDEFHDNPFKEPISKQALLEYTKKIMDLKKQKAEEEAEFKQYMADQQENVIAKNRAAKEERIRALREQTKAELLNKTKFKQEWETIQRKQLQMDRAKARIEAREREESTLREIMHVKEVKQIHEARLRQAENERKEALRIEAAKIQLLASEEEVAIINRQNQEEARMKYLEERQRAVEDKIVQAEAAKRAKLVRKQQRTADMRDKIQARVRMGAFKWHNGEFGYYDHVRAAPVEWVQYEDADGNPYYYDPVTQTSQYRIPQDANFHHYTEDERRDYDAVHGEGAYDAYKADIAWKDGVNRDGGYYNEMGKWVAMDGYFDENYEWVANEGYYDDDGIYRKYAKICGDLSFMV